VVSALSAVAAILAAGKWSLIRASVTHTGVARLCRMWSGVCAAIWANANAAVAGVESRRPSALAEFTCGGCDEDQAAGVDWALRRRAAEIGQR
jgi:hypothetical protein